MHPPPPVCCHPITTLSVLQKEKRKQGIYLLCLRGQHYLQVDSCLWGGYELCPTTYALWATFLIIVPFKHSFPYNNISACAFPLDFTIQRIFPGQSQQPNITTWLPFQITTLKASVDGVDPSNHTSFCCCTSGSDGKKTQWLTLVKGSDSRSKEGNLCHFLHRFLLQRFQMISDWRLNCRHHDRW
jgi:hypothetical protein